MFKSTSYDYIFLGAGCASLSLLVRMLHSGKFTDKKIVLIDKDAKKNNDRTWCFWEKENGFFDEVVFKKWDTVSFLSEAFSSNMDINPYQYKMIRGIDFYTFCFNEIGRYKNVEIVYAKVDGVFRHKEGTTLILNGREINLGHAAIFNSIYTAEKETEGSLKLLQHFKGWVIETKEPVFNTNMAVMMDFRVHQQHGTTFAYILPFSSTSALIEYTLFTRELLPIERYDEELQSYVNSFLKISEYEIKETEFGVIPMTNKKFQFFRDGIYHIGTAGGQTKGSSGYTFQFIQKQSQQILDYLLRDRPLHSIPATPRRFRFYDNTLLEILYHNKLPGKEIFTALFKKNKPQQVLKFLDNESSIKEELKIISSLPTWPFLKAALKQI